MHPFKKFTDNHAEKALLIFTISENFEKIPRTSYEKYPSLEPSCVHNDSVEWTHQVQLPQKRRRVAQDAQINLAQMAEKRWALQSPVSWWWTPLDALKCPYPICHFTLAIPLPNFLKCSNKPTLLKQFFLFLSFYSEKSLALPLTIRILKFHFNVFLPPHIYSSICLIIKLNFALPLLNLWKQC